LISRPTRAAANAPACPDEAVRAALKLVITSRQFAKAHRCATLLSYLIERALNREDASPPLEQAIGVAVFGRDPNSYYPGDDPIVRVQAGRLRLRLEAYYADEGAADPLRITIPLGSYQARIAPAQELQVRPASVAAPLLMFSPLVCLSAGAPASCFTSGLNDELAYRLYRDLTAFRLLSNDVGSLEDVARNASHVLKGTVRQDASRVRVSLHLRNPKEGTVMWYEQFDSTGDGSIAGQEQMAERCMQALQRHMQG
jgi:TolB-like protein